MKIRLDGTTAEIDKITRIIRSVFDVKSTSKFYPNARNSITDATGCVYVTLSNFKPQDLVELLTNDMFTLLARIKNNPHACVDEESEIAGIQQFYEVGKRGLGVGELVMLYTAWRDNILSKIVSGGFDE